MGDAHFIEELGTGAVLVTLNEGSEIPRKGDVFVLNRTNPDDPNGGDFRFTVDSIEWGEVRGKLWATIYVERMTM